MHVLVTGGAGFLGSHLVDNLLSAGVDVDVLDDLSQGHMDNLQAALKYSRCRFFLGSVLDTALVRRLVEKADLVFHLAALVGMRTIMEALPHVLDVNARGSYSVLEACASTGKRCLVFSSSEVYGSGNGETFSETSPIDAGVRGSARWSYTVAKICSERAALFHHRRHGLKVTVVRPFNATGVRQSSSSGMVVPNFVRCVQQGEPIRVFGSGRQVRTFVSARDLVKQVIALAMDENAVGKVVNVGGDEEYTIHELACLVKEVLKAASPIVRVSYDEAYGDGFTEVMCRRPDLSLLKSLGHKHPLKPLREVITEMNTVAVEKT